MAFIESETESDIDISEEEETFEDILSDIDISEEEERETLEDILSDPGDPEPSQSAAGESCEKNETGSQKSPAPSRVSPV